MQIFFPVAHFDLVMSWASRVAVWNSNPTSPYWPKSSSRHLPSLSPFLCSQSAVVSAPYRRWAEKLSWETKRTEEERQVGSEEEELGRRRTFVWGGVGWGGRATTSAAQRDSQRWPFHLRGGGGRRRRGETDGERRPVSRTTKVLRLRGSFWSGGDGGLFLLCWEPLREQWPCRADVEGKKKRVSIH